VPIVAGQGPERVVPQPRFGDLRRFCEIDGWSKKKGARGKTGDHDRYIKQLGDGAILRTRVSHSNDQIGNPDLWRHIWRDQFGLSSEDQFWTALRTGRPVAREAEVPRGTPEWLIRRLIDTVGLSAEEAVGLSVEEATARWEKHITMPREPI
jgi:hypothetical protein